MRKFAGNVLVCSLFGASLGGTALVAGCQGEIVNANGTSSTSQGQCVGTEVLASARVVRLSYTQIATAVRDLLGEAAAQRVTTEHQITDLHSRTFPPLLNPREGTVITATAWQKSDGIADTVGQYVFENFGTVTACGTADDACAEGFVLDFAKRAFRRPLDARESESVLKVYSEVKAAGGSVQEATQYGVYAALSAPQFLYRTEFGSSAGAEVSLTPYELASQLSFFLTDAPPDAELMAAAERGELESREQIGAQVDRILSSDAAKRNLEAAAFSYFEIAKVLSTAFDPEKVPEWNIGFQNSVARETELFLNNTLWSGKLTDLITSRNTYINEALAPVYGVPFPPPGASLDADGFALVNVPENRAGLLTMPGFLITRARPEGVTSVVGRGLLVNGRMLCVPSPSFPENLQEEIDAVEQQLEHATEKEKAEYRAQNNTCGGCHRNFDAYGLVLENYDALGRFRTTDAEGRPIDTAVTLPDIVGGVEISSANQLAAEIAENGAFERCMALNFMQFALADGVVKLDGCALDAVVRNHEKSSARDLTSLIREIAVSKTLSVRSAGGS
jgi:hypothetical protein